MILDFSKQLLNDLSDVLTAYDKKAFSDELPNHQSDSQQKSQQQSQQQSQLRSQLQSIIESTLRKCQLVTREEFDAQHTVLLATRQKLEKLEKQIEELAKTLNTTPPSNS